MFTKGSDADNRMVKILEEQFPSLSKRVARAKPWEVFTFTKREDIQDESEGGETAGEESILVVGITHPIGENDESRTVDEPLMEVIHKIIGGVAKVREAVS